MRHKLATGVGLLALTAVTAVTGGALSAQAAEKPSTDRGDVASATTLAAKHADRALAHAESVLTDSQSLNRNATTALAALRASYADLSPAEQSSADGLLARPTSQRSELARPGGLPVQSCSTHFCIHYTTSGADESEAAWVTQVRTTMESVWSQEVGTMGYRAPAVDDPRPDRKKFDVYLQNLGDDFLYGYCAPEALVSGQKYRASGYCVLDNNYTEPIFDAHSPLDNLRVTAAHEFFHAIQFNYDYTEDPWIMEATATWMEERYADDVNDNLQYLPYGTLANPAMPLDTFQNSGLAQYGNWVFFQRLSQKYGAGAIHNIWDRLDGTKGKVNNYSIQGVKTFLASKKTTLPKMLADYGAGNLYPERVYDEGAGYPSAGVAKTINFSSTFKSTSSAVTLNHLADKNIAVVPGSTLTGTWKLKINVDGPASSYGPAAYVQVVPVSGSLIRKPVTLKADGKGSLTVNFTRTSVSRVTLTLANAGTHYRCWQAAGAYSCHGNALDNNKVFRYTVTASR